MSQDTSEAEHRGLICEFLGRFYDRGWVAGTGGGICTTLPDQTILMAPSGVHKERVAPADLFVVDRRGAVVRPPQNRDLRPSECSGIFCAVMERRNAGSVMHSHALSAVLAADLALDTDRLIIRELEMLKGIRGCRNTDVHALPVIDNRPYEPELVGQIERVLDAPDFAAASCILVRDHGAYLWGADLWEAKRHAEVYHFLFEAVTARGRLR